MRVVPPVVYGILPPYSRRHDMGSLCSYQPLRVAYEAVEKYAVKYEVTRRQGLLGSLHTRKLPLSQVHLWNSRGILYISSATDGGATVLNLANAGKLRTWSKFLRVPLSPWLLPNHHH